MPTYERVIREYNIFMKFDLDAVLGGQGALEQLSQQYPNIKLELQNGYAAFLDKKYAAAAEFFEKVVKMQPIEKFYYLLILSLIPATPEKALEWLKKCTTITATYCYLAGLIEECSTNYRSAANLYQDSLEKDENFIPSIFRLGYYMSILGEEEMAIKVYERALELNPCPSNLLINLGLLYEDMGQYHSAIECYQKILRKYPNHLQAKLYSQDAQASLNMLVDEDREREQDQQNQILATPITDFELSVRSKNCLSKMKIKTLGDLIKKTEAELLSYKNFGETSLAEIKDILSKKGLKLGMGKEDEEMARQKDKKAAKPVKVPENQEVMSIPIAQLELSVRCRKCLTVLSVQTVGELCQKTEHELLGCKNFGQTSMNEIKQKLADLGMQLREES